MQVFFKVHIFKNETLLREKILNEMLVPGKEGE
jgi:hypothetical protein